MSLYRNLRIHQVFGGGTGIGKTIISTALSKASRRLGEQASYLKPIGTGIDSDDKHVSKFIEEGIPTKCLYTFADPVSPHLAAERMVQQAIETGAILPMTPTDEELVTKIYQHINLTAQSIRPGQLGSLYIETAGGVHSPTLAGNSQLEAFRPLRLPTILIGSPHLGGISCTISAYESLKLHGYDVDMMVVLREDYYENFKYLQPWASERGIDFVTIESPPEYIKDDQSTEFKQMNEFYQKVTSADSPITLGVAKLQARHVDRIRNLESMPKRALNHTWWPFLQHNSITDQSQVTVIDSAYKDCLLTHQTNPKAESTQSSTHEIRDSASMNGSLVRYRFDGSASWWTQSLGHGNTELALNAAYAAGRFGHVIFPSCMHEPALNLIERLIKTVGKGWANRVFFSDNGSTGVEVALKMGLASFRRRHEISSDLDGQLGVIGLRGSYHGDTIGAMDASEHSVYNAQVDWYKGKGIWLDAPQIHIVDSHQALIFTNPSDQWGPKGRKVKFSNLKEIYDVEKRLKEDPLAESYTHHIFNLLLKSRSHSSFIPASLIIEPVVMGAGGMIFVDPLFQNVLINVVRNNPDLFKPDKDNLPMSPNQETLPVDSSKKDTWSGLPIIFDEVFSGLYRLGKSSGARLLGADIVPDIAVYSKTLSAGTVPLSVTLAREAIFDSFRGNGAVDALLHGHSYTAHPVGCSVANTALKMYESMDVNGDWNHAKQNWEIEPECSANGASPIWSFWSQSFVGQLTTAPDVEGAMTLGTVLAIYLKDQTNITGYTSCAAKHFLKRLESCQVNGEEGIPFGLHARPLGNVAYFITSLNTPMKTIEGIQSSILNALHTH